jgi:hypothetical protein
MHINISRLIRTPSFWITLIVFALLTASFVGLAVLFIDLNNDFTAYQHQIYKSTGVIIEEYLSFLQPCGCPCYLESIRYCPCQPYPYTGAIIVSFIANNGTYFDELVVVCGSDYNNALENAKSRYPQKEKLEMYYNSQDPAAGVVFYVDYIGPYWVCVGLFFIFGLVSFMLMFSSCYVKIPNNTINM